MKVILIQGSSRTNGNTAGISNQLAKTGGWEICHLSDYHIQHYDYDHRYEQDDFIPLIKNLIERYDVFVFATPVYWYSMSGIMKVFFDRFTDLLKVEKDWGRKLRSRKMAVISSSNSRSLEPEFWNPFRRTANYLGMEYLGDMHFYNSESTTEKIETFVDMVQHSGAVSGRHPFQTRFLDHVAIRVRNIGESSAWYQKILGLKKYTFEEWGPIPVFMMAGTSGVALFPEKTMQDPGSRVPGRCADHFAFHLTYDDLQKAKQHFEVNGLTWKEQDHYFFESVYTTDPDGHTVELTALKPGKEYFYDHPAES